MNSGDYLNYVDFCFATFGDRVKHWFMMNEPYEYTSYGYAIGAYAPGRCSNYIGNCLVGDSATEPYIVGHHLILSHAVAVKLYRKKYKVCNILNYVLSQNKNKSYLIFDLRILTLNL